MGERATGHNPRLEGDQSLGFIVGVCLCLVLSLVFAAGTRHRAAGRTASLPDGRINPNEASAASLARLPGIGPTRAAAIVTLRDRLQNESKGEPAFRCAEDLAQVKGIGPATVDGLRPWLRFNPPPANSNEPSLR